MGEIKDSRIAKGLKWAGRIIVYMELIFVVIYIVIGVISATPSMKPNEMGIIIYCGIIMIPLVISIISWWNQLITSILLLATSIGLGFLAINIHQLSLWIVLGFPYLVAGLLFFGSWRLSKIKKP
jgi:hypothetical protein